MPKHISTYLSIMQQTFIYLEKIIRNENSIWYKLKNNYWSHGIKIKIAAFHYVFEDKKSGIKLHVTMSSFSITFKDEYFWDMGRHLKLF